jgi:predicted nucleic acid-binding protein
MTVLIDSWAWIEYWKGGRYANNAAKYIESDEEAFVSTINLTEIYSWFARSYGEKAARERIELVGKRTYIMPLETNIALDAAILKLKHKLGIADAVVLATARHVKGTVITGDPDFKGIDGVTLINE